MEDDRYSLPASITGVDSQQNRCESTPDDEYTVAHGLTERENSAPAKPGLLAHAIGKPTGGEISSTTPCPG
jgi:hypothetical protein